MATPAGASIPEPPLAPPAVSWPRLWFSVTEPVSRRAYVTSGIGLAVAKFAVEWLVVRAVVGKSLPPLFYVVPLLSDRLEALSPSPEWLTWALAAWTLPFLWIATSMSVRRSADAGWSPWLGLLVVLPVLNIMMALLLSFAGTRPRSRVPEGAWRKSIEPSEGPKAALLSGLLGVAAGIGMVAFSTLVLRSYGGVLFVATPIALGAVCGYVYNASRPHSIARTLGVVTVSLFVAAGGILAFALEGAVCIVMIAPLALVPAWLGALIGRGLAVGRSEEPPSPPRVRLRLSLVVLALPLLATLEANNLPSARFEVSTSIEVDAPPDVVWKNVVSFSDLPEPDDLIFRLGVAHPRRARIDGSGVGAIRHCEFSTGAFVEPITVWDAPRRLAFDVTSQPPPMEEWSPYKNVHPAHLDGYIRSKGGEFRLVALDGNRTRLEGSTWYELDLFPTVYFRAWSDSFIHRIHDQVLEHVKRLSEAAPAAR